MDRLNMQTPGVYINEINAFPNSVVAVPTAVPAFIGYTPAAMYEGKSYTNVPKRITSFAEFKAIYCLPDAPPPAAPTKQYSPEYYLVQQKSQPTTGDYLLIGNAYYAIVPDPNTIYYMYNSIRLFYENGGGTAYIVSVGSYGVPAKKPMQVGNQLVNPNVKLSDLMNGLALISKQEEPTMYICPEATLLSVANNGILMQQMLLQCSEMQTAMAIFDVIGGHNPDPVTFMNDITTFRNNTGTTGLDYGAAYYPFVETSIMQDNSIDYTNLFGADTAQLAALLNPADNPNPVVASVLATINTPASTLTVTQNNNALLAASPTYGLITKQVLKMANTLPTSGAMAGLITRTDNNRGVWKAPANMSVVKAVSLPIKLTQSQQEDLNVDAVSGKSINAIRFFDGEGVLVWGARTLDGNSSEWKYIPVRRTIIMIEQSCKAAARAYVFEPNDANTWAGVKAMINNFLTGLWRQGGLMGATPDDAFSVECGLGVTMTADDILKGVMNITMKVAIVRPAEFIVISFQQKMQKS